MADSRNKLTNDEIIKHDWAAVDRQLFLRANRAQLLRKSPRPKATSSICGSDVSGSDGRSVKAYLNGRGDLRTAWWLMFARVYGLALPQRGLEHAMYAFHTFHHRLTLAAAEFVSARNNVERDIQSGGLLAALKNYR